MSDSTRGPGAARPPWSVDVLADLHAGALDARQSAALWAQVNRDPEAQAVLAALDSVRRDLDTLGDLPVEPMPHHFAAKLDAAIAAEAARSMPATRIATREPGVAPVVDMSEARRKRTKRLGWAAGVLTAAAAAVAVTFAVLPGEQTKTGGIAEPGDQAPNTSQEQTGNVPPLALKHEDLGPAISGLTGQVDYGELGDEQGLKQCLSDQGIEDPEVIGAREVTLDGTEGVAALLARGEDGHRFRLVIVDPGCTELITNTSLG